MSLSLALRLRSGTADAHHRIEASLDLLGDALSPARYVQLLRAFYGFLVPWEAAVAASGHVGAGTLSARRHTGRLAQDLVHFGQTLHAVPRVADLPALDTPGRVLGSRYVIEGSTLGGQVIGPHLQRRFGLSAQRGAAYFDGYGARNGAMWRAFGAELAAADAGWHDDALDGARQTFERLGAWLVAACKAVPA